MKILLTDDNKDARFILKKTLEINGYTIKEAYNGISGIKAAKEFIPDMIISDVLMPEMDGFKFCMEVKKTPLLKDIPFIFYTAAYVDPKDEKLALALGAVRFIIKPIEVNDLLKIIKKTFNDYAKKTPPSDNQNKKETDEIEMSHMYEESIIRVLDKKVQDLTKANILITEKSLELEQLFINTMTSFAVMLEGKSQWTKGHSERVTELSMKIGESIGIDKDTLKTLNISGLFHDIGKIATYDHILNKTEALTSEERDIIQRHPIESANILMPIKQMKDVIPVVKYHHERMDGKGYPEGIKGDDIPLLSKIICVADSYDAIVSDRPYRRNYTKEFAVSELKRCSGTQFDSEIVKVFLGLPDIK